MAGVIRRKADWTDLRVFWAVAESGSFGAAARALNIGLTTATRAVDRLEGQLNVKLLVRGPHGVTLTEAGRLAQDRALTMERAAEQLEIAIADLERAPEGRVKLAGPDGVAGIMLPPFMREFVRAYPGIDLVIDCGLWQDHPLDGDADLTLTFSEPKHPDAVAIPLAHFHYGLFASREYLDLYGAPESVEAALAHPFVHHSAQMHQRDYWRPRAAAFHAFIHKRVESNSSALSFEAIKYGVGLGVLPTAALLYAPTLVRLETPSQTPVKLWLVHHRDVARSVRIRCVIDWLKEVFDPRDQPWYRAEFVHPREFEPHLQRRRQTMAPQPETAEIASLVPRITAFVKPI
jgi:DNA-binding transcriptional LysR family regulator